MDVDAIKLLPEDEELSLGCGVLWRFFWPRRSHSLYSLVEQCLRAGGLARSSSCGEKMLGQDEPAKPVRIGRREPSVLSIQSSYHESLEDRWLSHGSVTRD